MSLPRLAVNRPITTAMVLVSVALFGGIAALRLPLAYLPEIDAPFIAVQIPYPNANPAQVEREVVKPVEEILSTLSGVKKLHGTADADEAWVSLEFRWGQDLDILRMQVSEKVDQIKPELPERIGEIRVHSFNTTDMPVVEARISAEGVDLSENYDLIEARILNRIRRVPGVARVEIDGVAPKEIFIELVLDRVLEHGVDVGALVDRLQGASSNLVLGEVHDGGRRFTARALGAFGSVDALRSLPIDERGLRLGDVAEIYYEEPPIAWSRHLDLKDAIAVTVSKESTANTVEVVQGVHRVIRDEIDGDPLLQGISLFVWEDQAEEILNAVNGLSKAGLVGALLAVAVLYLFLRRLGPTLIVSMSIPFSIIAACGVMFFLGKSLNVLSMMGLMLGVGMLVDNAIVVLESIDRRSREEADPRRAALDGARSVVMAVTAATLTSLIVFLPLVVGEDSALSTWLGEVGITICLALLCSLFSSLTLIPMVSARLLRNGRGGGRTSWVQRILGTAQKSTTPPFLRWLEERYARALGWTLRHRWWTAAGLLAVTVGGGLVPFQIKASESAMFSAQVNKRMYLRYDFSDFVYKSEAERMVDRVEAYLDAHREEHGIESIYSFFRSNHAGTTITLARQDLDDEAFKQRRKEIREGLPEIAGVKLLFDDDSESGGDSTFFSVHFFGQDTGVLAVFAEEGKRRIESIDGIADVSSSLTGGNKEIEVEVDRAKAARLGLTAQDVSDLFGFTLGGLRLPRFNAGGREVETSLALRLEDRENLEDLRQIQFQGQGGGRVTLGDIATFQIVERPESIRRENRKVRVSVRGAYEGEEWQDARERIEEMMNAFSLPGGYSWSWNDRILEQDAQNQNMMINLLLALVLIYLVMASLFESLAQPFAILSSIFFALPGVAWMLILTGTDFNLMGMIGLLILMGIVVNNGIVLLDHMNHLRRAGVPRDAAIIQAGRDRMRAILMTASTTVIGLLPLALGGSRVGGLFYFPLALTVMGGLISSAALTLLGLPFVNLLMEGIAGWLRALWRGTGEIPAPEAVEAAG